VEEEMKVQRVELLTVYFEPEEGRRIKVGGQSRHFTGISLASSVELKRGERIIDEVQEAVSKFPSIADKVGLPKKQLNDVAKRLGVARKRN
jgi:hypothetical protein